MVSVIDKIQKQETVLDHQLMQLALVDIASGLNSAYEIKNDNQNKNSTIYHIIDSQVSFKLVSQVIKMESANFLKPFQLQTVMLYA